jgi:hypothetical protein
MWAGPSVAVSVVVLTPPLWWGVMEALPVGDAYSRARQIFEETGEWPEIAAYDRRRCQHQGLIPEPPSHRSREDARALAAQARKDAMKPYAVHAWLDRFASRLQAEADFDMTKGAALWR